MSTDKQLSAEQIREIALHNGDITFCLATETAPADVNALVERFARAVTEADRKLAQGKPSAWQKCEEDCACEEGSCLAELIALDNANNKAPQLAQPRGEHGALIQMAQEYARRIERGTYLLPNRVDEELSATLFALCEALAAPQAAVSAENSEHPVEASAPPLPLGLAAVALARDRFLARHLVTKNQSIDHVGTLEEFVIDAFNAGASAMYEAITAKGQSCSD